MYISIIETKNNIFVNIITRKKKLVFQASGGMVALKGARRKSPLTGEFLGKLLIDQLAKFKVREIAIYVHGPFNRIVRGVFRGLTVAKKRNMRFIYIFERKGIAHNGVRLRKRRRL